MKKIVITILMALLICLAIGCAQKNKEGISAETSPHSSAEGTSSIDVPEESGKDSMDIAAIVTRLNQFSGVSAISYASDHEIAVLADKLYLYDLGRNTVSAKTDRLKGWGEDIGFYAVDGGYAIVACNEKDELECTYYDTALNKQETVNIPHATNVEPIFVREIAVSADGKLIAISDISSGLYVFNRQTDTTNHILTLESSEKVAALSQIAFSDSDQMIVFIGQKVSAATGKGESVYGSISIDGSHLNVGAGDDFEREFAYDTHVIFGQDIPDEQASGKAWVYSSISQKADSFLLAENSESTHLWGSYRGNYVGTTVYMQNEGWIIRIYETMSGNLIYEKFYAMDTNRYGTPQLYIFDDAKIVYLYFRPLGDNKTSEIDAISF